MDGQRFDDLIKRLAMARITRVDTLRGLAGGAIAALSGALVADEDAEAKKGKKQNDRDRKGKGGKGRDRKGRGRDEQARSGRGEAAEAEKGGKKKGGGKKKNKKKTICHCPDGNPANCQTLTVGKKAAKKHLKRHQFDQKGACTPPVTCTNNSECAPRVCVDGQCQPCTRDEQCDAPQVCNEATGQCQTPATTTTSGPTTTTTTGPTTTTTTTPTTTTTTQPTTTTTTGSPTTTTTSAPVTCPAGQCTSDNNCGTSCTCLTITSGVTPPDRQCVSRGTCPVGVCDPAQPTPVDCGTGCRCEGSGTNSRCVSLGTCPAGTCNVGTCGTGCVCVNPGAGSSRCVSTVI